MVFALYNLLENCEDLRRLSNTRVRVEHDENTHNWKLCRNYKGYYQQCYKALCESCAKTKGDEFFDEGYCRQCYDSDCF